MIKNRMSFLFSNIPIQCSLYGINHFMRIEGFADGLISVFYSNLG